MKITHKEYEKRWVNISYADLVQNAPDGYYSKIGWEGSGLNKLHKDSGLIWWIDKERGIPADTSWERAKFNQIG